MFEANTNADIAREQGLNVLYSMWIIFLELLSNFWIQSQKIQTIHKNKFLTVNDDS